MRSSVRQSMLKPPEDQIGVVIGSQMLLARSERAAVVLHTLIGYPEGITAELGLHLRQAAAGRRLAADLRDESGRRRFRIAFAFGEPTQPLPLSAPLGSGREVGWYEQTASGTDLSYTSRLWISPYPRDGSLLVSCDWGEQDIVTTTTRLVVPGPDEVEQRTVRLWEGLGDS